MAEFFKNPLPVLIRILAALGLVILAVTACVMLNGNLPQPYLALIFLVAVLIAAAGFGRGAGLTAAFASFFAYNFFFIPPTFTFTVADPREFVALVAFLMVALLTGTLAGRLKENAAAADHRAQLIQSLYDYAGDLAGTTQFETALRLVCDKIQTTLNCRAAFLSKSRRDEQSSTLPDIGTLHIDDQDRVVIAMILNARNPQPQSVARANEIIRDYLPVAGAQGTIGIVVIERDLNHSFSEIENHALQALIKQAGIAIERIEFAAESQDSRLQADQERLRSAILSALSHDLRTPLASILGSATALRQLGENMTADDRDDLLAAIEEEAGRLNLFVGNLLAMTRLETGIIDIKSDHVDCAERARAALERARRNFPDAHFSVFIDDTLGNVRGDAVLLEQVIFNLIDNAIKFSGNNNPVFLKLLKNGHHLRLAIEDEGPGIAPHDLDKIFDKFYRVTHSKRNTSGFGLGLTIGRGVVTAMGGTLHAESPIRNGHGARFVLELPLLNS
ncbi:MAG: ATP-binding protein [Alphaproteobacteria bacterium]